MVKVDIEYTGDLHCDATHGPSQSKLGTDAPSDNKGKGEAFSPTDLVATALGTCISTTRMQLPDGKAKQPPIQAYKGSL